MRKFARTHWKTLIVILVAIALATLTLETDSADRSPGTAARLQAHARVLAEGGGQGAMPHLAATLGAYGYRLRREGKEIEAALSNTADGRRPERMFIVGVRTGGDSSGAAALLELARQLRDMAPSRGTEVRLVFLEQGAGSFIAFAGSPAASARVRQALGAFTARPDAPAQGLASPAHAMGLTLSGHATGGYASLMVTDTAFQRYPYYQTATREPDYEATARVVDALARTIRALAGAQRT
jgi:hypothetical protein